MPIIRISLPAGRRAETKTTLMERLWDALQQALGAQPDRIHIDLIEIDPLHSVHRNLHAKEFALLEVNWLAGKSAAQKEAFYKLAAQSVTETLGIDVANMILMARDLEPQNLCFGGSESAHALKQKAAGAVPKPSTPT